MQNWLRRSFAIFLAAVASGAAAGEYPSGAAAFDAKDYAAADALWRQEAASGSPAAMQGLGYLRDLGLGQPRDSDKAFAWYVKAAKAGHAPGAFNVGVLLDGGSGAASDLKRAAVWYGRSPSRCRS